MDKFKINIPERYIKQSDFQMNIRSGLSRVGKGYEWLQDPTNPIGSFTDKKEVSSMNRIVLITGSTRGIGLATAAEFETWRPGSYL